MTPSVCRVGSSTDVFTPEQTGLSPAEETTFGGVVRGSLSGGTRIRYDRATCHWDRYLLTVGRDVHPGSLMQRLSTDAQRSMRLALFVDYLHDTLGLRGTSMSAAINGLRMMLMAAGRPTAFFTNEVTRTARRGAVPTAVENARAVMRAEETRILPLTMQMIERLRLIHWPLGVGPVSGDSRGLDSAARWIAVGLGSDGGLRISNLARTAHNAEAVNDFRLRGSHVSFVVRDLADNVTRVYKAGAAMRQALQYCIYQVEEARIIYTSSKSGTITRLSVDRTSGRDLLEDLVEWVMVSLIEETDVFTTRVDSRGNRRELQSQDVAQAIKRTAAAMGLEVRRYSTRSMRSFFTTMCAELGVDAETRGVIGGWASGSRVPDRHYNHAVLPGVLSRARSVGTPVGLTFPAPPPTGTAAAEEGSSDSG